MDTGNLKQNARELERQGRIREALAMYRHVLTAAEGTPELLQELPLYVKAGDLYLKLDNPKAAVSMYERVGQIYAEHGSAKSVSAVCAKVLRVMPERSHVFQRLVRIMLDHGHVAPARDVMVLWAEQAQLENTRRALDGLGDRSAQEVLPVLVMLLELAERVEAAGVETLPKPTLDRSTPIAEIEPESATPALEPETPADAETDMPAEPLEEQAVDEEEEVDKKVLTPATMGENLEFRSERFGAESLMPSDEKPEEVDATEAVAEDAEDVLGDLAGLGDLAFVPGENLADSEPPDITDVAPPSGLDKPEARKGPPGGAAETEPESAAEAVSEDRRDQGPEIVEPRAPLVVFEPAEEPRPRPSPARRSPVGSVLLVTTDGEEEGKSHLLAWAGGALGLIVIVVVWIAFGLPPFSASEAQVPEGGPAPALDETGNVQEAAGRVEDLPVQGGEAPADTGLPATLEPNPALAVMPVGVPEVDTAAGSQTDSSTVVAIDGLAILDARAVTDAGLAWHEIRQVLAAGQEVVVRTFPSTQGPAQPEIDSADGTTTARLSVGDHLVVVSGPVSETQVRLLIERLSETRIPPN